MTLSNRLNRLADPPLFTTIAGSGSPILFIHGNFNDHRIWDEQASYFQQYVQVIRYDLRGYGESSTPTASFSHVEDLKALLMSLNIGKVNLVGSSMGGGIAVDFASAYPEYVQSLVLAAPSISGRRYPLRLMWKGFKNFCNLRFFGSAAAIEAFIRDSYWQYYIPSREHEAAREKVLSQLRNPNNFCRFPPHLAIEPTQSSSRRIHDIQAPALILISDDDHPYNLQTAEYIVKHMPHAHKVVMENSGHLPFVVKPEAFNRIVHTFISNSSQL